MRERRGAHQGSCPAHVADCCTVCCSVVFPCRRSRHMQPSSDQPPFRWAAAQRRPSLGFPGAQTQQSCVFAPGNPGLGPHYLQHVPCNWKAIDVIDTVSPIKFERECCLLVLNLVSSTLSCIRQPRPRLSSRMMSFICSCRNKN